MINKRFGTFEMTLAEMSGAVSGGKAIFKGQLKKKVACPGEA